MEIIGKLIIGNVVQVDGVNYLVGNLTFDDNNLDIELIEQPKLEHIEISYTIAE